MAAKTQGTNPRMNVLPIRASCTIQTRHMSGYVVS